MKTKAVFPGKYIQGKGAINELPELIKSLANKGLLLGSKRVIDQIIPKYASSITQEDIVFDVFNGECCEDEISRVLMNLEISKANIIIGMGGGKVIDTAKIVADRASIPVIVVPTIASTDAPTSGCAVTYASGGVFERVHYQKMNPTAVLVDLEILADAPSRFLVSGMGDALATWFEAHSCHQTQSMNECGGLSTLAGLHIARLCYDTLLEYGYQAKMANENHLITPAFEFIVEANTLLSGIGFESSGLAAAHAIHNGLTVLEETHSYFHGEKVAFGTLAGLFLTGVSPKEISIVFDFCDIVGLPTTLADVGIIKADRSKLMIAADKVCQTGSSIFHETSEMNPEKVLNAMLMADAYGRDRLK